MTCTFIPVNQSWVAFAENRSAVVLWIGGAFFGTLPTVCYKADGSNFTPDLDLTFSVTLGSNF